MPWPKGRPCPPDTKLKIAASMLGKNIGNPSKLRHGHAKTGRPSPEFVCWQAMKRRCLDPNRKHFSYYGGRGITVCDRWLNSFENFLADMGPKPSPHHSIDRYPDNNGNYEPTNCRWATRKQQQANTRRGAMKESRQVKATEIHLVLLRDPVFVCSYCGTGFLRWPGDFHRHPKWGWTAEINSGGMCGGPVIKASRAMQIRTFDRMEREDAASAKP